MAAGLKELRHYGHVHLWTLRDTPQSHRFYAKSGFVDSGRRRDYDFGDGEPLAQVEFELTR